MNSRISLTYKVR